MADPAAHLQTELAAVVERDLPAEVVALLVAGGPDEAHYPRLIEHLSIYLDAHWGDRAVPPPDGPGALFSSRALIAKIAERAAHRVDLAVELGCSTGRIVAELARGAESVVGVELSSGATTRPRRQQPAIAPYRPRGGSWSAAMRSIRRSSPASSIASWRSTCSTR